MTRTEKQAIVGAVVTMAISWRSNFRQYGIAAGLFWLAVTYALVLVVIWAAGSSTKNPDEPNRGSGNGP